MKFFKHSKEEFYFVVKCGCFYEFDAVFEYRLRAVCLSAHINWSTFLTEYKEIDIDELPDNLQGVLEEEAQRSTI